MRLTIVSNKAGEIFATCQPKIGEGDAPKDTWITALEGQMVHEVEAPDNLAKAESIIELHNTHRIEVIGKNATLVQRKAGRK